MSRGVSRAATCFLFGSIWPWGGRVLALALQLAQAGGALLGGPSGEGAGQPEKSGFWREEKQGVGAQIMTKFSIEFSDHPIM